MQEETKEINIALDFSRTPGPRFIDQGPFSGEKFRKDFLEKTINLYSKVVVNLDGTAGYGSSFLDEAFGGLIRHRIIKKEDLLKKLEIISTEDESYKIEVNEAIKDAVCID
jgi:hypothetical protein